MLDKGTCKHGEFDLIAGCPQCITERRRAVGIRPEQDEMEDGLNAEGLTLVGADEMTEELTTTITQSPVPQAAIELLRGEADNLLQYAKVRVIQTVEDAKGATDDLSIIAGATKLLEAKRKEYLKPLDDQRQLINDTFKLVSEPLAQARSINGEKLLAFKAEQERVRLAQEEINRKRLEAAQEEMALKGELTESVDLVEVAPDPGKQIHTNMGTAGTRDHWKYEVIDFYSIPREYLMVDNAQLTSIAKGHHDQKQVPGVRFYNEPILAVSANKG